MCGLIGLFTQQAVLGENSRIKEALKSLHHRGPDNSAFYEVSVAGGNLILGHIRLSIIDLSAGGHQPMHSNDGRYTIIFNDEIYNYRELRQRLKNLGHGFHSNSDTEVLLIAWAHWGVEALKKLKGMFVFVVFDHNKKTLTLVRDAFGIKPLFYKQDENGLSFASEIPAILELFKKNRSLIYKAVLITWFLVVMIMEKKHSMIKFSIYYQVICYKWI